MNINNVHCRHIVFGCSHDNGYARLLEEVVGHPKVSLLEGVPFERELSSLKPRFKSVRFDKLFRTTKVNVYQQQYHQPNQMRPPASGPSMTMPSMMSPYQLIPSQMQSQGPMQDGINGNISNGAGNGPLNSLPPGPSTAAPTGYESPYQKHMLTRTPSESTNSSGPVANSWATKAGSAPPIQQLASPPPTPKPATIPRNKYGQRIDTLTKFDVSETKRVQKIKMCNVHFLRKDCPYGDECTHEHAYKPNKNELETLRQIARGTPCKYGTSCDDIKCIYGHR